MSDSERTSRLDVQRLPLKKGNLSVLVPELAHVSLGIKEPGVLWVMVNSGTWPVSLSTWNSSPASSARCDRTKK